MKKIVFLVILFIILTSMILSCPVITLWDKSILLSIQHFLNGLPLVLALLPDCKLYVVMICLPIFMGGFLFLKKKQYSKLLLLSSMPLVAFLTNVVIKNVVQRPRPPYELQPVIHPHSFSYVSSHSLVTFALYGLVIFFLTKCYSKKWMKSLLIAVSFVWILFVGISRIWLGVHYPTDVLAAYILGGILLTVFIKVYEAFCE